LAPDLLRLTGMRKFYLFIVSLFIFSVNGQEKIGISNSNYSSTNSIFLNPSSSVDSRTYMQLNLGGGYVFGMNNIGYLPKFGFYDALRRYYKGQEIQTPEISKIKFNKFLYGYGSVDGPVFVMTKRNYGWGVFIRGRTTIDAKGTPFQLTNILLGRNPLTVEENNSQINVSNARFCNMSWIELGGNFGIMTRRHQNHMVTFGGNLKYIRGVNIVYGNVIRLQGSQNDSAVDVQSVRGKIRFTENDLKAGNGIGLDLGITYKKMLGPVETYNAHSTQSNCKYVDYKYKVGVSLRDAGFIRFKRNTSLADLEGSGYFYTNRDEAYYRQYLGPDLNAPFSHIPFLAALPTNLSVQYDYNFGYNFYFNATAVKNIVPNRFTGAQSHNMVSFCPRYETKVFEVALPLTLHRYIYPQIGVAFRIRSFVLGFDNLLPIFIKKKTYGVGIYCNVAVSLFRNKACRTKPLVVDDCPPGMKIKKSKGEKRKLFRKKNDKKKSNS
jgi:hypothetical protein